MKTDRQRLILKLVSANRVHNQEELQGLLEDCGVNVTQATLSRDVNELDLVKYRAEDGSLCYRKKQADSGVTPSNTADGIVSVEFSGNLAVVKTHPGFASVIASAIDRNAVKGIAGTIAGDDAILLVLRMPVDQDALLDSLDGAFPGIHGKIL